MKVVYAERAQQDIDDIYNSIAPHSRFGAQRVENLIRRTCEGLAEFPFASAATDEPNVRRVPLDRFPDTVFYRIDADLDQVQIARIVHSSRVPDLGRTPTDD